MCLCKCICHVCEVSSEDRRKGVGIPEVGTTDDCMVPNIGAKKQILVPWENRKHP